MPTYEYECEKCKKTFELFQSMKDAPLKTCTPETCCMKTWGKGKVRRLLGTGAGVIFKGSGFYQTDYRSAGYKEAAKKDTQSPPTPPQNSQNSQSSQTSQPPPKTEKKTQSSKPEKSKK